MSTNSNATTTTTSRTWTVYHGGSLYGLGVWSEGHTTRAEALASARECRQVVGGEPFVERTTP